ncbi:MAG: glycosyltransferase [Thermodesulfobacteriota bacterium]
MNHLPFMLACVTLAYCMVFWALRNREIFRAWREVPVISSEPLAGIERAPLISVIVPAHNEEAGIVACLMSVIDQDYPHFELIVVDDRSGDRTAELARSCLADRQNCQVITVTDLPAGWTGKCHALHVAVGHAKGEWFAFLDADSLLHRSALSRCYKEVSTRSIGMITLSPKPVIETFWEKALQPVFMGLSCIIYPLPDVNDPTSSVASANGMFYLIGRNAYERIGGHLGVRGLAVEDIGIGKRVKALGLGLLFANGREVLRTRMYTGFTEIVRGWTRIHSASMNYEIGKAATHLAAHSLISTPVVTAALFVYVPTALQVWPDVWWVIPCVLAIEVVAATTIYYRILGVPARYSVLASLGNMILVWELGVIIKKILLNEALQWRGTTYPLNRYRPTTLDPRR